MARLIAERADIIPVLAETFRKHGYEGASLTLIGKATGLGKGSLYHFFPGGKAEMAQAVLDHVDAWFQTQIFAPLCSAEDAPEAIAQMFARTQSYFESGGRVCLVGLFALGEERDRFANKIASYFADWIDALTVCLVKAGREPQQARALAEEAVAGMQGAIVLARALGEREAFSRALTRLNARIVAG
jgi:TetR/AcrR family transcriptional repressor of lmrAB and yxaGH operons